LYILVDGLIPYASGFESFKALGPVSNYNEEQYRCACVSFSPPLLSWFYTT